MNKMNAEKKNVLSRKLSLNRETLRTLSPQTLEKVAGGEVPLTFFPRCWQDSVDRIC